MNNESEDLDEGLVKVFVDLPNHWATGGESMWAKPLGNDLYEIRNSPFYAFGLNWGDIVKAESVQPDQKPEISEVVTASGNKTLRIYFSDEIDRLSQQTILDGLKEFNLSYERANNHLVALDIEPDGDYGAVCDKLWEMENQNILEYETCEPRVEGSFDDSPESEEGEADD